MSFGISATSEQQLDKRRASGVVADAAQSIAFGGRTLALKSSFQLPLRSQQLRLRRSTGCSCLQPGSQDAAQFDLTARDITAFLEYAGEPAALKREQIGVWVLAFLALLALLAWMLKNEYWKDVH